MATSKLHPAKTAKNTPTGKPVGSSPRWRWVLAATILIALIWFFTGEKEGKMADRSFDAERVAYFESAGWRAYYDRNWLRVLGLMVQLNREQFGMSWPNAILASLDVVRASLAFAPVDNDIPKATGHLAEYYAKARRAAGISADAETLAALEMDYWVIHRRLANERKAAPDHTGDLTPMVDALASLHAALFAVTPEVARASAEMRAAAAARVDRITGGYSDDVEADWAQIEFELGEAYGMIR